MSKKFLVYHYSESTGEYLRSGLDANVNPKHPGQPLIPRFATTIEPPVPGENLIPVWVKTGVKPNDGSWELKWDYRKNIYYNKETKEEVKLELGVEPNESLTVLKPEDSQLWDDDKWVTPFEVLKELKLNEINALKWSKVDGGTEINGMYINTDADAQRLANGAVTQCLIDPSYSCDWKMTDGNFIKLNSTMIIGIAVAIRTHIQGCFDKEAELVTLVKAAETPEDLDEIVWE